MIKLMGLAALSTIAGLSIGAQAQPFTGMLNRPSLDRWMYPFNSQPGTEATAPIFAAIRQAGFDDRDGQCLLGFATSPIVPTGAGPLRYIVHSARISIVVSADLRFEYDPSFDSVATLYDPADPDFVPDTDPGKPIEIFAAGFRNGTTPQTFTESSPFSTLPTLPPQEAIRSVFAAVVDESGAATDVSLQVRQKFEAAPLAVGQMTTLAPGALVPQGTPVTFEIDVSSAAMRAYFSRAINSGTLMLVVSSLHPASGGPGGGTGEANYPAFYTKENAVAALAGYEAKLELSATMYPYVDFDMDGDAGTDLDIEAFFNALGGGPGNPDFDMDGDVGTDLDIEAFFRALGGG